MQRVDGADGAAAAGMRNMLATTAVASEIVAARRGRDEERANNPSAAAEARGARAKAALLDTYKGTKLHPGPPESSSRASAPTSRSRLWRTGGARRSKAGSTTSPRTTGRASTPLSSGLTRCTCRGSRPREDAQAGLMAWWPDGLVAMVEAPPAAATEAGGEAGPSGVAHRAVGAPMRCETHAQALGKEAARRVLSPAGIVRLLF